MTAVAGLRPPGSGLTETKVFRATRSQDLPGFKGRGPEPSGVTAGCWSRTSLIAARRRSSPSASRGPRSRNRPVKSRVLCPLELETRESVGTESNCHSTKATGLQPASLANGMPTDGGGRLAAAPRFSIACSAQRVGSGPLLSPSARPHSRLVRRGPRACGAGTNRTLACGFGSRLVAMTSSPWEREDRPLLRGFPCPPAYWWLFAWDYQWRDSGRPSISFCFDGQLWEAAPKPSVDRAVPRTVSATRYLITDPILHTARYLSRHGPSPAGCLPVSGPFSLTHQRPPQSPLGTGCAAAGQPRENLDATPRAGARSLPAADGRRRPSH